MANEKRLIYADDALRMMKNSRHDNPYLGTMASGVWELAHDCGISCVDACPTVDAVEVVHGRWEEMGESDYKCSVCGFRFTSGDPIAMFSYCRCGAKMDGGNEDG